MSNRAKQTAIYGNWVVLHPDGFEMFKTSEKKVRWYLDRELATTVGEKTIKLAFVPAGMGHKDDPFHLGTKANACVVCGVAEDSLNRHHIVPYQFRRHFPLELKTASSYDVVPICLQHHDEYETHAQQFALQLGAEHGLAELRPKLTATQRDAKRVGGYVRLLESGAPGVPTERVASLEAVVEAELAKLGLSRKDPALLPKLTELSSPQELGETFGQKLVEALIAADQLHEFVMKWRRHFMDTMQPLFMSSSWTVDRNVVGKLNK